MVMTASGAVADPTLCDRLPTLWRAIENAHYSYLATDDSPDKIQQRDKLERYIMEYLTLVPHECKFGLSETAKVFQRTVNELPEFSAYRAGLGWAALARYASNLLAQPWRKEYKTLRLYSGYYKHEIETNLVGAEILLQLMGYKYIGHGKLCLEAPLCPDMVHAISRDALIANAECQIMCTIWESVWVGGRAVSWEEVSRHRALTVSDAQAAAAVLTEGHAETDYRQEIYSNVPTLPGRRRLPEIRRHHNNLSHNHFESPIEESSLPMVPYMIPQNIIYPIQQMHPEVPVSLPQCNPVPMMTSYVPYYYPVQAPYMMPTPVYAPIKQATNVPVNGYPPNQYRYPAVPTGQLIELEAAYENGRHDRYQEDERSQRRSKHESYRRNSTSKSGFSDVSLPSLPRSDTQPALRQAREDGMGTYESWDYVFRNLSSKDQIIGEKDRYSPSLDRDSRTLDRLDRDERRAKYQPTTLDLEDGLQALNIDRSYDEQVYRTTKVNESLMKMKHEQDLKRAKMVKRNSEERKKRHSESQFPAVNPVSDALISCKVAEDKVKLLNKREIKDRKEVIKQQINGSVDGELKKSKKPSKTNIEQEKPVKIKSMENGHHSVGHSSRNAAGSSNQQPASNNYDLKTHLVVSLDEVDSRRSPPKTQLNGDHNSQRSTSQPDVKHSSSNKWECSTCTYLNRAGKGACEMCGKSKRGPEIQPLTAGGRECPACTLVNKREARSCDACGTSLDHCPTYI